MNTANVVIIHWNPYVSACSFHLIHHYLKRKYCSVQVKHSFKHSKWWALNALISSSRLRGRRSKKRVREKLEVRSALNAGQEGYADRWQMFWYITKVSELSLQQKCSDHSGEFLFWTRDWRSKESLEFALMNFHWIWLNEKKSIERFHISSQTYW